MSYDEHASPVNRTQRAFEVVAELLENHGQEVRRSLAPTSGVEEIHRRFVTQYRLRRSQR